MTVKIYVINEGTPAQYYGLKNADPDDEFVLMYAPNNWKTKKGAARWAEKQGLEIKED